MLKFVSFLRCADAVENPENAFICIC